VPSYRGESLERGGRGQLGVEKRGEMIGKSPEPEGGTGHRQNRASMHPKLVITGEEHGL